MGLGPLIQDPPGSGAVVPVAANGLGMALRDFVSPRDYRTAIDADDTNGVQLAANAAITANKGLDLSGILTLSDTITLQSQPSGSAFALDITSRAGVDSVIRWTGASNKPIFRSVGMKRCDVKGVRVQLSNSATGTIAFDCDVSHSPALNSSIVNWIGCHVMGDLPANGIGWRIAHASQGEDASVHQWFGCTVTMTAGSSVTGWQILGGNTLNLQWFGGGASGCTKGWTSLAGAESNGTGTTTSASATVTSVTGSWTNGQAISGTGIPAGTTVSSGGGTATLTLSANATASNTGVALSLTPQNGSYAQSFFGVSTSHNGTDFEFAQGGNYIIRGGRYEVGSRFLNLTGSLTTTSRVPGSIDISGIGMVQYNPGDGILFNLASSVTFSLKGSYISSTGISAFGADMIHASCFSGANGSISVTDTTVTAGTGKLYTLGSGTWAVNFDRNLKGDPAAAGAIIGTLDRQLQAATKVVAAGNLGSAYTLDCTGAAEVLLQGTLNANCTVTLSAMQAGLSVTAELTQDGTGSRTVTFSPTPKMPGGAITLSTAAGTLDVVTLWSPDGSALRAALVGKAFA